MKKLKLLKEKYLKSSLIFLCLTIQPYLIISQNLTPQLIRQDSITYFCFTNKQGNFIKNVSKESCQWCPFKDSKELCDKDLSLIS
jgi:hypothetical protein